MILSKRGASLIAPAASIGVFILLWGIISLNVSAEFLPSPLAVVKEALRLLHANIGGTSLWGHTARPSAGAVHGLEPGMRKNRLAHF